jgi:hypothetical protein
MMQKSSPINRTMLSDGTIENGNILKEIAGFQSI